MKPFYVLSRSMLVAVGTMAVAIALEGHADALTPAPPDLNSSCSASQGVSGCFRITNFATGFASAIEGRSNLGIGLAGYSIGGGTSGIGVQGVGPTGVRGETNATNGIGVIGTSANGIGVSGTAGDGIHAGVQGRAFSSAGTGVRAIVDGTGNGSGVWSTGPVNGFGVFGEAMGSGYGVYGYNGGSGYGVYGYNHSGGYAGYFDGPAFTNSGMWSGSDARLKKEIHEATHGLTQVLKMRPVTYKWKSGGDETVQLGFIAQDIQKIVPEVVHADGRTQMLSINYPALLPVVVKAAQEQQQIIQRLEDRIARLERGNKPLSYSLPAGGIGLGVAFGLVPFGLLVANRRRKEPKV